MTRRGPGANPGTRTITDQGDHEQDTPDHFAIVPEWLIDADVSDGALRLYAVLARYADKDDGTCWPSRATLAGRTRSTRRTVDRRLVELVEADALTVRPRYDDSGRSRSNLYEIHRARGRATQMTPRGDTGVATGGDTGDTGEGDTDVSQNESHLERESPEPESISLRAGEIVEVFIERDCGGRTPSSSQRKAFEEIALDLVESVNATREDVRSAYEQWGENGWDHRPTARAIARQWATLIRDAEIDAAPATVDANGPRSCPTCGDIVFLPGSGRFDCECSRERARLAAAEAIE